ncbi:MAG: UbiA family prenyltransferase [Candidatus Aenigmarchaeota archaeon]|nr:UbiA family prenyltransferase [Candidatus Aenigmarchaeota archaeon]
MLRVRNWLGYFLIATLGYVIFTKLNAYISETIFFYALICLCLGFSFSINNCFDNKEDLLKIKNSNPVAAEEIRQKEGIVFSLLLAFLGMILSLLRGLNVFYFFSVLIFLSFSYSSPPFRLKSKPLLDLISHGLFFGSLLFLFPSVFFSKSSELLHILIAISIFYFSLILELRNHIEDYDSDKKAGLRTTVCMLGLDTSKKLTHSLSLLFPLSLLPVFFTINKHTTMFLAITAVFYLMFCTKKSYRVLDIYSNLSYFLIALGVLL